MTLEQLETKVNRLERQLNNLERTLRPLSALPRLEDTFGMFSDDPGFEEVLKLGREYRDQANQQQDG